MIKRTTYEAQSQAETDYIENYGKPNPEVIALQAQIVILNQEVTRLAMLVEDKNGKIANLNARVLVLEKQLADCQATTQPPVVVPELYFEGNFELPVTVDRNKIYGWDGLTQYLTDQFFSLNGTTAHIGLGVVTDNGRKVLKATLIDDDPATSGQSRFQWNMQLKNKLEVIHYQHRLYLSPDIADLNNYTSSIKWFSIFEMWNDRAADLSANGPYDGSCRWNLNIHKETTGKLYWAWIAEYMQPTEKAFTVMYPTQKSTAEIPLGRWFTLDIYFNRNGKTVVKIDNTTLFDFTGQNIYPGRSELYPAVNGNSVNPFKLYTSDLVLDWIRGRGKSIWAMYNDLKWFKS